MTLLGAALSVTVMKDPKVTMKRCVEEMHAPWKKDRWKAINDDDDAQNVNRARYVVDVPGARRPVDPGGGQFPPRASCDAVQTKRALKHEQGGWALKDEPDAGTPTNNDENDVNENEIENEIESVNETYNYRGTIIKKVNGVTYEVRCDKWRQKTQILHVDKLKMRKSKKESEAEARPDPEDVRPEC